MTPVTVLLRPGRYATLMGLACVIFVLGAGFDGLSLPVWLMTACAVCIHNTNFILRDQEFNALCVDCDITRRDIFGRSCMLIFDGLLLSALLTGAGLVLNWGTYLLLGAAICVVVPLWTIFQSRNTYNPTVAQPGFHPEHWIPPLILATLLATFAVTQTTVAASGPQPYATLVLLSSVAVSLRRQTTFFGFANKLRYATLLASVILVIWNYLNIA